MSGPCCLLGKDFYAVPGLTQVVYANGLGLLDVEWWQEGRWSNVSDIQHGSTTAERASSCFMHPLSLRWPFRQVLDQWRKLEPAKEHIPYGWRQ